MPNFFDYSFPVVANDQLNPGGNSIPGNSIANVPPKKPESFFFIEPVLNENQNSKTFGALNDNEFQITTTFNSGSAKVKAFAVTSGTLFFAQYGNSTDRVNIFLKPNKDIGLGLKIKYFVYRGIKTENLFKKVADEIFLVEKLDVNTLDFLKPVWDDYVEFNQTDQDFKAQKIGYLDSSTPVEKLAQMFFTKDTHSLLHVAEGMHIGNFEGDFGFEIIVDEGDFIQTKPDSGLNFNEKFANAKETILKTNGNHPAAQYIFGGNANAVNEKVFRENIYQFLDPAAFYGTHITDSSSSNSKGGKIKVKNSTVETVSQSQSDIFTNVLSKFKNKNKVYVYIKSTRGRSYNFYNPQTDSVKITCKNQSDQLVDLTEFQVNKWPIQVFDNKMPYTFITLNLLKPKNNCIYFHTGMNAGRFYDDTGLLYPQLSGTVALTGMRSDLPNSGASLLYLSCSLDENVNNLFGPVDLDTIFEEEDFSEFNKISWVNHFRPILVDDKNQIALYNTKIVIDKSANDLDRQYRTYLLEPLLNTLQPDLYAENLKPSSIVSGYCKKQIDTKNSRSFCADVLDISGAEIWRGEMNDNADIIKSLALRKDENVYNTDRYVLGITEKEFAVLKARIPASIKSPNAFVKIGSNIATDQQSISFAKYAVQLEYDDDNGLKQITTAPTTPTAADPGEIYLYTIDGLFFFTKSYSANFPYYSEFANTTVEFRPGNDWMKYFNYPLTATKTLYGKPEVFYGFDWLRKGDSEIKENYRIFDKPIFSIIAENNNTDQNEATGMAIKKSIYHKAKKIYRSIPTTWKLDDGQPFDASYNPTNKESNDSYDKDYAPSWLNIPRDENGVTLPLKLRIKLRSKTPAGNIKLYYNSQLFKINKLGSSAISSLPLDSKDIRVSLDPASSDSVGVLKFNASDIPVSPKSIKWIDFELENISPIDGMSIITVMADDKLAGKFYIMPNNAQSIIKKKVILTKVNYNGLLGTYDNHELELVKVFSKQTNIYVDFQVNANLNLVSDPIFQQYVKPGNGKIDIDKVISVGNKNYRAYQYLLSKVNDANSIKIFIVKQESTIPPAGVMGFTLEKDKFVMLYSEFSKDQATDSTSYFSAMAHEFLHSQGLAHTFTGKAEKDAFLTIMQGNTNNVMDYSNTDYYQAMNLYAVTKFVQGTFFWQWGIARQFAKKN